MQYTLIASERIVTHTQLLQLLETRCGHVHVIINSLMLKSSCKCILSLLHVMCFSYVAVKVQ